MVAAQVQPAVTIGVLCPDFTSSLDQDLAIARPYFVAVDAALARLGPPQHRDPSARERAAAINKEAQAARDRFFRRHAAAIYDELTGGLTAELRLAELVYKAAERCPMLLPTRRDIDAERAQQLQIAKEGREIDQGLFVSHLLADDRGGPHLVHAMLRPKREAHALLPEFVRSGRLDLGSATIERRGKAGHVTLTNPKCLNAEDDAAVAALETAVDLVLLDDQIEMGVLRGGILDHPKYNGRRVFNAGINLTHLYFGQISYVDFFLERDLGYVNKIYRGHWRSASYHERFEDTVEKPWLAVVEAFAIGGGCQLLCVMDRVIAEEGAYFNLPASREGFIPGAANLRLPRLTGIQMARQAISFEKVFHAGTPDGMMICDETVPSDRIEAAIERNIKQMVRAGPISAASNRKALRVGQEPLSIFRRYMATYSRQQCLCVYDRTLMDNLEQSWEPQRRQI